MNKDDDVIPEDENENTPPEDNNDPDDQPVSPVYDPEGEFDPTKSYPEGIVPKEVRIVDGVSSEKTYAVMATNGEHRMAVRWLCFKPSKERNRNGKVKVDGKTCMSAYFKVHIEKDGRNRVEISERSFAKFGLPSVFSYRTDRFTGIVEIPFAYLPNTPARLAAGFDQANLPGILWDSVLQPALDVGAEVDVDKRQFAKWVYSHINTHIFEDYGDPDEKTRGYPVIRAYWEDMSGEGEDQSNIGGSFPDQYDDDEED